MINEFKLNSEKSSKLYRNKPAQNLQESKLYIYKKIKRENPKVNLALTKYYKLCPKNFQYSKKKTDMCDICINGKKLTKKNHKKDVNKIEYYNNHLRLNKEQKKNFKEKIINLNEKECCLIMDFKENFKIGGGPIETSQIFYNKSQVSCLGFCLIYKEDNQIKRKYYNYLSKIITHDSYFVIKCLESFQLKYLSGYNKVNFWSDNAGHFRSAELMNYILLELPKKRLETTMNFFVEYHGKSDIDGHFGHLQKAFKAYERLRNILSLEELLWCFNEYFNKVDTNVTFEIYDDPGRKSMVKKLCVNQPKVYLSFINQSGKILGSSVSTFKYDKYQNVDYKIVYKKETRKNKYAPKIKCTNAWDLSPSKIRVMGSSIALAA